MEEYKFKINGHDFTTTVDEKTESLLNVTVNGRCYKVELPTTPAPHPVVNHATPGTGSACGGQMASSQVEAPLPGTITNVVVKSGQKVKRGDVLVIMEAMKMANDIVADGDGTVESVKVKKGQSVNQGDLLVTFKVEPNTAAAQPAPAPAPTAPVKPAGPNIVASPLPGTITKIMVKVGQKVNAGDTLMALEAMKMENSITAEATGTAKEIMVKQGEQVQSGQALIEMA